MPTEVLGNKNCESLFRVRLLEGNFLLLEEKISKMEKSLKEVENSVKELTKNVLIRKRGPKGR